MKAILKPFFALCGLVALSTALSADSRLFPVGGGGAGWGEPGFLYSDYLQTAAASGREVEFQGSFVLDNRRPFLAELGTAFPGRVVDEVKSLPLREWGLGYVFEKRRPAHQRALLERGWRLADWLAEETLMAATESSRGGGLIRTLEFDLQSELGGRRAQVGLNVLGALRESNDEAIAWQFRGFKSSGGLGGNTGLIWRRAVANDRALAGANVFLDYETYADENFWRGSAGAELRSAWADVFGNVYRGFSDDVKKNNRTTYTADGYDVELNVHSPELPWLVGEVAYYNFEGKAGDKDDDGVRFGLRFNPLTDLELGVEYDNGDSDDDGKKKWAARIRYSGEFGGVLKAQYRPSTNSGNFEPRDWFFAPAEREYSQRIRKSGGDSGFQITVAGVTEGTLSLATNPIQLRGALSLDITSTAQLPRVINVSGGTVILSHKTGQVVTLFFPRTRVSVITRSTVAFSLDGGREVFSLLEGQADIVLSTLSRGMLVVEQRVTAAATSDDRYRQITLSVATRPVAAATLLLTVRPPANANIDPARDLPLPILVPVAEALGTVGVVAVTNSGGTPTNLTAVNFLASVELANDPVLTDSSPPSYYKGEGAASSIIILGTLRASGGGGRPYTSSKVDNSGDLVIDSNGVVGIPTSQTPQTGDGRTLVLQIMVNDNPGDTIGAQTDPQIVGFTVVYRQIVPLSATLTGPPILAVYGVLGDSARKDVTTAAVVGGAGAISYSPIDGALRLDAGHVVYIPAGNPPLAAPGGNLLTLNSEIRQAASDGVPAMTVTLGLTVRYIGLPAVSATLAPTTPAVSTGLNSFAITAEAGDTTEMDVLVISGRGGAGGTFTMRRTAGELSFVPNTGRVYFSSGTAPRSEAYTLVVEIDDSGTGQDATPTYTLTVRVQYDDVEVIRVNFNDPDGLVTVYGLQGQATAYANVAQVETGGGFGAITLAKEGGDLDLVGRQINIPAVLPTGQDLVITVSGNDSETNNPEITDAATAILTVEYAQVPTLNATFSRVNARNGQVGSALGEKVLTVGMTTTNPSEFTVAKVVAAGGVGSPYTYTKQSGNGQLDVNSDGEVLIAANTPPGDLSLTVVVQVDDSGDNSEVSPAFLASLTVFYNTIGVIAAEVVDTRNNAVPSVIKADGGTVYFLSAGANTSTEFGRLEVNGGLGNQISDYDIVMSNPSGITYDDSTRILSMDKCSSGTKSIRFTINDDSVDSGDTTEEIVFDVSLTNECVDAIAAQLKDAANANATSPLNIHALESKTDATVVAVWTATGGGGDLTWSKTGGDLNLTSDNRVQVPQGTSPGDAPNGDALVLTAMVNDEDDKGGFLTAPVVTEMTVNYIEVPAVRLALNDDDNNAITSPVNVYGVESVAKAADKRKVANIAASGGAGGALALSFQTSGDGATTAESFEIVGNNAVNITKAFPAFGAAELATVAVVASDSGANSGATPDVTVRATVRLLPVLAAVQAGGNIVEFGNGSLPYVASSDTPSATEGDFTVYVLGTVKQAGPIVRVNAAATGDGTKDNANVAGVSGLRVKAPTRHSTSTGTADTGLGILPTGNNSGFVNITIGKDADATSGGTALNLVLEYDDEGFDPVATLTAPLLKTVNVDYREVSPLAVQVLAGGAFLADNAEATVYVAPTDTDEKLVARVVQTGGATGALRVITQTGDTAGLEASETGGIVAISVKGRQAGDDKETTLTLTVTVDDADGEAGSVTDPVTFTVSVAYLESRHVIANFEPIAAEANDEHFIGALAADGTRTVYLDASETRAALPLFRLNAQSGTGQYVYDSTSTGFNLMGFTFPSTGNNNRILSLEPTVADGTKAYATVQVDDSGDPIATGLTDPAIATVTVEVKLVTAIAVELLVPEDVPGGPTAGDTLGALYVRSAAAANSSSVHIANASASKGVEQFTYTRQSESSAELLLNADGEVHLAANYTPDGNKTLSIIIAANDGDSVDGSTLTEAAMITLEFVLAETIGAVAFLRNNSGAYVPNGTSGNDVAWGSGMRTVKVKTADYGNEQLVVGVRGSGGLGNSPAYSIARATGGNENGLVTRTPSPDGYGLGVAVKDGAVASSAPQTFGITAVVNESGTDPNNLTPGATISLTVVYDKVDDIAAAFEDTDGDPIPGRHVVARSEGVSNTDLMVASLNVSGGVGKDTGGDYTFTQDTPGDLIVNSDGGVLVKGGVVPAIGKNLEATVKINDTGNWAHVSDELEVEITVLYSSKVVLDATIVDTRDDAVPANIPRTGGSVYFLNDDPDENAVFARVDFSGALPGDDTYVVTASDEVGLSYDPATRELSMTKCTDTPSATKRIKLTANDSPDTAGVSDPLVVEIEVTSGAAQCFDAISARPERLNAVRGAHITDIPKFYRLAGDDLDADLPVATVHVDGGAPAYVSDKTGGVLNLVKGSQGELTVVIPSGRAPEASPNNLEIVLTVNDDSTKGGFLTDVAEVKMTVDFAEVQPHGNLQGVLADGVTGSLEDGLLTVRRVAASSTPLRIVTNIRPAIPTEERIATEGSFTNFQIVFNTTTNQQDLQLIANQVPDGEVRMITVKVENHKNLASADDEAQFAARPDRLFTIAVRYLGELEAAAYDSETETAIAGDVNRYVESDEGAVAVATVSVSGGTSPYSYNLVAGGLELGTDLTNMTVLIPASAVPSAAPGLKLTVRIEVDDNGRTDTAPLNVELTANYILIPGHSDLQLVRDGRTQAEDLDGDTVYPKIVGAKSSGVVEALSGLAFKAGLSGETLKRESSGSAAELLFADDASVVQIAGDTEPDGSTLALVLRASDGESPAQAKARSDRLYTLQVRYMKELTADARTAASGGDVINAVREIRVTEAEADDAHFVAHISVDGGAGGNVIAVEGTNFVISGNELQIAAAVNPGDLATGNTLIATVKVNDKEDAVGGGETGEVEILVTANYITLPPVEGSFVEGRDGTTEVPSSSPVIVYSTWTSGAAADATVAATAKATVTNREGETYTFHKVGTEGKLEVNENSGAVTLAANYPSQNRHPEGRHDFHTITVEFRAATNAVATQQTLTVRHQMVHPIIAAPNSFQSRPNCHPGNQINGTNDLEIVMAAGEAGSVWNASGQCSYLAFSDNIRVYNVDNPRLPIARTIKTNDGLNLSTRGSEHIVGVAGNTFTYTASRRTLSIVIAYNNTGPGSHVTDEYLRTVYVVFPGVPKLEAVLEDASGADSEITKPLTVYVGDTDASAKVVASVKASGGAGSYTYTGTRTGGDNMALLLVTTAESNNIANQIAVPAGFVAKVSPGDNFQFEVAVDDTGNNAGVTTPAKVTLTLQYIKTSGPLQAEAAYTTPDIADAANTTYYGAKGEALGAAVNVANIAPSGGIPNYSFAIEEDSSNPAANSELEISGSGNTRVVRLKSGATPSAATSEARRRVITVRVTDTGDVGNSILVETVDVVVSVNFVEVETHGDLTVEDAGGNNLGTDFVVVTSGVSAQDVVLAPAASVYPERPTRRQDLGREAGVVSEVSHHGLRFNSNGLVITANTPLEGQTLSVVVQATDGATSQPTAAAQAAARQDQTYTISVRYVPAVAAEVLSTTDAALSNTDVVELTVVAGTQLVGKVAASGGVGGIYSYTPTPAQAGGTNLAVDADGNINIIAGTTPVAGDGLSITVNIAVDDDSANTEGDRDETSAANVQIRVKYVLLEDLALTAKDAGGNNVGAEASLGTFYLRDGASTDSQVLVGSVEASGGIQGYTYARKGTGGDLTFDPQTRQLHIPNNTSAADPNTAAATLLITVQVTDSQSPAETTDLTVRAVFVKVSPHGDLTIAPESGITPNSRNEYVVVRPASHTQAVDVANITAPQGDTVSKTGGDSELEFTAPNLRIANNTSPTGQTVTAQITQTDGGDADDLTDEKGARPDRIHQIAVRYIPALAAEAQNAAGDAALNAPIVITSKAGLRQIARIAVSGGTSDSYSYTIENLHTGGNELMVGGSDGIVSIPAGVQPIVGGLALTVRITANDSGDDNDKTDPASAEVTVMYHLLESPEIEAQNLAGTKLDNTNTPTFYRLSGSALDNDLPVAKVVGSKGSGTYTYAIVGADGNGVANGMRVDTAGNEGNIVIVSGQSAAAAGSADRIVTVRLTDDQGTPESADATLTIRFEAVAPHDNVQINVQSGVTRAGSEFIVVQAGAPAANVHVMDLVTDDTLSKTGGDAALAFVAASPHDRLEILSNTPRNGQTLIANIRQTDGDDNDLERTRPDQNYVIAVRYIPALAAEVRNAAGDTPLAGVLEIEAETPASLNIASIAVSGGTSDTYTYAIRQLHSGGNALGVTDDGVVYIPAGVAPLPTDGLSLTVEITANDKTDSKNNGATAPAVASITVRYVMDPGLQAEVQDLNNVAIDPDSPPAYYQLQDTPISNPPDPATGRPVAKIVATGGDTPYSYAVVGDKNSSTSGLDVDASGNVAIQTGQTPDTDTNKKRLLTVKITDNRATPRETQVIITVIFRSVAPFGDFSITPDNFDADKNSKDHYVLVRAASFRGQAQVIGDFYVPNANERLIKFAGDNALRVNFLSGLQSNQLLINVNTVPGGQPPVPGGLTLVAQIRATDGEGTPQERARPDRDYEVTVIYLAEIDATVEDASNTEIPDLTNVDISGPTGVASVYVADIKGSGGTGEYTYTKAATNGGVLEVDDDGQVYIPSGQTPTADDGTQLHILVDVNDTDAGVNDGFTAAKRIRIDVDYILEPGLGGVVQKVSDSTGVTSPTVIYRLAGDAAPAGGLPTGLKVVGIRGEGTYTYAIDGTNNSKLVIDASSGEVSIAASAQPDGDEHVITVKITDSSTPTAKEAMVTLTANFRAVQPISSSSTHDFLTQAQCHEGNRRNFGPNAELRMPAREEGFEFVNQNAPDSTGTCGYFGHFVDELGNFGTNGGSGDLLRTVVDAETNGLEANFRGTGRNNYETRVDLLGEERHTYTAGETTRKIVIAYNDNGAGADVTPEYRKTLIVVFPGIPSVDAVLNDAGGTAIPDIAAIEKRGPGNLSVFIGNIVASGGTGGLAIVKAETDGGELEIDNSGQVYIPDSVQPEAGAGNQLHLLVNINDSGANSDRTAQKQLRIEVDYIFEAGAPPLSGQVQDGSGSEVSGVHNVFQLVGYTVPSEGLDTGIKVVASNGESPYSYAVQGSADPGKLAVDETSGAISIQSGETPGDFTTTPVRTLTVRITDNASETADVVVEVKFASIERHGALARTPASGVVETGGIYYVSQDGTQSGMVDVLNDIAGDGHPLNAVAGGSPKLVFAPPVDATFTKGNLKIAANTEPTGQRLIITIRAHDGDDNAAELARPDRFYEITVVYLNHLSAQLWDAPSGGATIDIATAIEKTSAAGASVFVGSVSVSGGTGAYEFTKGTCTNLDVDADGNVFIPTSAAAPVASPGTPGSCQVIINDSGDGSAATPAHGAFNVQVNHILQETGPTLPLYAGDLFVYRDKGAGGLGRNRICPFNTLCEEIVGVVTPEIVPTGNRLTVFGFNTDTAPVFIMSVGFSAPGPITEASGSHFSVGAAQNAPNGTKRHSVMLKTENLKRWGQELEARFRVRSPDNTLEQLVTVTVLLAERVPPASLTVGITSASNHGNTPGSRTNTNANRPMQWLNPNDVGPTDTPPGFQAVADFPGMTVTDVEVVRVRVSALVGNPPDISTWGDFQWDEEAKIVRRNGIRPAGSDPFYDVWVRGKDPNPKMVPTPLSFRLRYRGVSPLAWQTTPPSTIAPSGVTSFEVKGGAQARNYSPLRDMVAEVNAPFVISNMRISRAGSNDWRFLFDVGLSSGASAGAHTANIVVRDRGYTSFGTLTHTATATK